MLHALGLGGSVRGGGTAYRKGWGRRCGGSGRLRPISPVREKRVVPAFQASDSRINFLAVLPTVMKVAAIGWRLFALEHAIVPDNARDP